MFADPSGNHLDKNKEKNRNELRSQSIPLIYHLFDLNKIYNCHAM